jgi:tetratricopeptide (TPR) repeat protein
MSGANKTLEGYAAVPAAHTVSAFRTLAGDLEDDLFSGPDATVTRKQLTELIAAHRKREPGDPWLWYYEGALHQHAKEYEKAEKTFAAGAAELPPARADADDPDESGRSADLFRTRRVACLFELKKGLDAYRDIGPPAETFRQLAWLYDAAKDFDGLADLIAAHRDRGGRDPERTFWQAHLFYRTGEYGRAVPVFYKYLDESDEKTPNQWGARDELIRCVLRTKPADAGTAVRKFGRDNVSAALRAAIAAATGDRDELDQLLTESAKNGGKTWFYVDEDFRRFIYQNRYRDLRAKYPDPNPPVEVEG